MAIKFNTKPVASKDGLIVTLPIEVSKQLPSRSFTFVEGKLDNTNFLVGLEPNGEGEHWFLISKNFLDQSNIKSSSNLEITLQPLKNWPEPPVPGDLKQALDNNQPAKNLWSNITPAARWDWIRWLDSVKLADTRKVRPAKLISMLKSGKKRPCCFNRYVKTNPRKATAI